MSLSPASICIIYSHTHSIFIPISLFLLVFAWQCCVVFLFGLGSQFCSICFCFFFALDGWDPGIAVIRELLFNKFIKVPTRPAIIAITLFNRPNYSFNTVPWRAWPMLSAKGYRFESAIANKARSNDTNSESRPNVSYRAGYCVSDSHISPQSNGPVVKVGAKAVDRVWNTSNR